MIYGETRRLAKISLAYVGVLLIATWIGADSAGVLGACWAMALSYACVVPLHVRNVHQMLGIEVRDLLGLAWRPTLAVAAMYAAVDRARIALSASIGHEAILLALLVSVGATTYIAGVLVLWRAGRSPDGAERIVLDTIRARIRRSP